jgi:hypothetical protein
MTNSNLDNISQAMMKMKKIEEICLEGNDIKGNEWSNILESAKTCTHLKKGGPS